MPDDVFCHLVLFIIKIRLRAAKKKQNPNQNPSTQQNQPKIAEILWVSPPNPGIFTKISALILHLREVHDQVEMEQGEMDGFCLRWEDG